MSAANTSKPGRAAVWKLSPPPTTHPAESTILPDDGRRRDEESIIGEDQRALVDFGDLQEGGKYRSIVKIQARFENKATGRPVWMMGTGWLIRPDLLVTAGHVVYDWGHRYGAATQIRCYIGYNGRASVKTPQVQARYGINVVTTAEWIEAANNRMRDVAFIQVDRSFTGNLRTFNYVNTPMSGNGNLLGVVGYPGDKILKDSTDGSDEYGAQMYEEYAKNDYDLETSSRHMIEYQVSTYGGQSGAPILRRANGQLISIGTHCYGGGGSESNSGNSIGNTYGNNYEAFVSLFSLASSFGNPGQVHILDTQAKSSGVSSGTITYPAVTTPSYVVDSVKPSLQKGSNGSGYSGMNGASGNGYNGLNGGGFPSIGHTISQNPAVSTRLTESEEEGFMDIFKKVARIGSKILPVASPLLGPVGGLLGPAVGGILGSLGAESGMDSNPDTNASAERAILAEAALQAVLSSEHTEGLEEVVSKMQSIWRIGAPRIDALASALTPIFTECGLELATHRLEKGSGSLGQESVLEPHRRDLGVSLPESAIGGEEAAFIQGLMGPTRALAGEEGMFDWLGPVLKQAALVAKPIVSQVASAAITSAAKKLKNSIGAESTISAPLSTNEEATKILLHRAVLADTALQALMTLPREKLNQLKPANQESGEAEGIFDFMKTAVQKIGPIALDTAKSAAKKYLPRLIDSASQTISGKLGLQPEAIVPVRGLVRKQSFLDVLNGKSTTVKVM
ncbi:hypothetical protein B0T10DRAFT_442993 [Thelonectria olida]|uniref:Serine protease n=1 Tax=Thelonectria olida TaxID=1576542 RepID=A0A9P8W443_9HYPO|nr:hypothetical protein B0T10DRAFT_442993 [Thelonectria olida]